jgi:hypothetical protein
MKTALCACDLFLAVSVAGPAPTKARRGGRRIMVKNRTITCLVSELVGGPTNTEVDVYPGGKGEIL